VQSHPQKFAPTLAVKWYPQDFIGRAKLFDISAATQYQGFIRAANIFSACTFPVWPAKRRVLQRAVCHLAARIDNKKLLDEVEHDISQLSCEIARNIV